MIRNYVFNGYRRLSGELFFWVIPFSIGTHHSRVVLISG
jgi:ubiquinol-cytochrome c reductase subunit 8